MDRLKTMKEHLTSLVDAQISGNIENVNSKELGEAVDMIKDLAEAVYYCTITEAMEGQKEEEKMMEKMGRYYTQPYYHEDMYPERMYYGGRGANGRGGNNTNYYDGQGNQGSSSGNSTNYYPSHGSTPVSAYYSERPMMMEHDPREGRSYMQRRHYMESKEMHQDSAKSMQELDKYIQELSSDITDMIKQATPEEKQMLQQKISMLATKIK